MGAAILRALLSSHAAVKTDTAGRMCDLNRNGIVRGHHIRNRIGRRWREYPKITSGDFAMGSQRDIDR
jgi:hypothetical protein